MSRFWMMAYPPMVTLDGTGSILRARTSHLLGVLLLLGTMHPAPAIAFESDPSSLSPQELEFFEKSIRPLFVTHCYECHSGNEKNGGLKLDSRDAILRGGDSGPAIRPREIDLSLIIKAVRYQTQELQMPPKGALPASDIALLERWIAMGAPDPRTEINLAKQPASGPSGMSVEEGRRFWSLRPISNPAIPQTQRTDWARSPIDGFVLSKLEDQNLSPAPEADRRSIVRRLTLGLTGLPPTPDEMAAFASDESPYAYDQLIERLLASPQYGVHWGRHWLDVARYADSNGLDENLAFGTAWRYRDYVIQSINNDKPIDTFIVEQIAGDLIPNSDLESKTGTGFLVLGAKVLAEPDREKLTMDTIDEQIDTLGKAFLGMTLGCARCHDHKFDPIQQKDYYALAAIFKSTKTFGDSNFGAIKHWNEISLATNSEKEELKKVTAEIAKRQSAVSSFKSESMEALRKKTRSLAATYLATAPLITPEMTLQEIESIAAPLGLHPRVLFHCRRHLQFHSDHPLFVIWHESAGAKDYERIRRHYTDLFERTERAFADAKQRDSKAKKLDDPELEMARAELYDVNGFLAVPPKPGFAFDESILKELDKRANEARLYESFAPDEPSVMGVSDGSLQSGIPLHIRGNHRNLGENISRGFPDVMCGPSESLILSRKQSGRLELARWLTSPSHPLTARVFVNRVWRWHFGQGLVGTTENFGVLGDRPVNPQLLDYLARYFMESGWSLKELHRVILRSSAYRMGVRHPQSDTAMKQDSENRFQWRYNPQRMSAEQVRDSILFASGQLDLQIGGKMVPLRNRQFVFDHTSIDHTRYDSMRRAAYLPVIRNNLYSLFEQFDFPDPTMPTGSRNTTTVAPQALLLMNSEWVIAAAERVTKCVLEETHSEVECVNALYQRLLGRKPSPLESNRALEFVLARSEAATETATEPNCVAEPPGNAWMLLAQSLLICNEFVFIR
ncbi:MAG: PSD1 and planctomycete cytochrome C domain-containing protein [Pirellula sp.]